MSLGAFAECPMTFAFEREQPIKGKSLIRKLKPFQQQMCGLKEHAVEVILQRKIDKQAELSNLGRQYMLQAAATTYHFG